MTKVSTPSTFVDCIMPSIPESVADGEGLHLRFAIELARQIWARLPFTVSFSLPDVTREIRRRFAIKSTLPKARDAIANILNAMMDVEIGDSRNLSASHFQRLQPLTHESLYDESSLLFYEDATVDAVDGKVRSGVVWSPDETDESIGISGLSDVPSREARGKTRVMSRRVLRYSVANIPRSRKVINGLSGYCGPDKHGRLYSLDAKGLGTLFNAHRMSIDLCAQLSAEYSWTIEFLMGNGMSLMLPSDADGVRRLLKDREMSPGKKRRDAVRHFVSEHYRFTANEDHAMVRRHLRGVTDLSWAGFQCRVRAPLAEVRAIERAYDPAPPSVVLERDAMGACENGANDAP